MIKINLDTKPKGRTKNVLIGSVEVNGNTDIVAHEIYAMEHLIDSHMENIGDV